MAQRVSAQGGDHVNALAKQFALPHDSNPLRLPSFPAVERTAVMGFNQPTTLALTASASTKVLLMRQPTYPAWAEQVIVDKGYYVTHYSELISTATTTVFSVPLMNAPAQICNSNLTASAFVIGTSGSASSITSPPMAYDNGYYWFYVPNGWRVGGVCGISSTLAQNLGTKVNLYQWVSPNEETPVAGANGSITPGITAGRRLPA
jgi:hypothetical protein